MLFCFDSRCADENVRNAYIYAILFIHQIRREGEHFRHPAAQVIRAKGHSHEIAGNVSVPGELCRGDHAEKGGVPHCQMVGDCLLFKLCSLSDLFRPKPVTTTSRSWSTAPATICSSGRATAPGCRRCDCSIGIRSFCQCSRWTRARFDLCWAVRTLCVRDWRRRERLCSRWRPALWWPWWRRARNCRWPLARRAYRRRTCECISLVNVMGFLLMDFFFPHFSKKINKGVGVENCHYLNDGLWQLKPIK